MQKDKRKKTALAHKYWRYLVLVMALMAIFGTAIIATLYKFEQQQKKLTINNLELKIETASTREAQTQGLSGRKFLSQDRGMLFVFESESEHCFWMKDMSFALDIIWMDANGKITNIKENISPDTYPATFCGNGQYVLEINADLSNKNSLQIGQVADF